MWRRHWKLGGKGKWLSVGVCLVLPLSAGALVGYRYHLLPQGPPPAAPGPRGGPRGPERNLPLVIRPTLSLRGELEEEGVREAVERLRHDRLVSMSFGLHLVRLFGPEAEARYGRGMRAPVLDILLEDAKSRACFRGEPSLIDTRYGVRSRVVIPRNSRWQRERQAHEDQLLALLAEAEVPLDRVVTTDAGARTVRRILDDTLAKFDPDQPELEWSALAILLYHPPRTSWADKFGRTYDFDGLARELLERPVVLTSPCGGTHLLYAMAAMLQVSGREPILSADVQARLRARLEGFAEQAVRSQDASGVWAPDWYEEGAKPLGTPAPGMETNTAVHITGHQVEWLMLLPDGMRPPDDCFLRALRWLQVALLTTERTTMLERYCPYSHAGRVLKVLTLDGGPGPSGPPVPGRKGVAIGGT